VSERADADYDDDDLSLDQMTEEERLFFAVLAENEDLKRRLNQYEGGADNKRRPYAATNGVNGGGGFDFAGGGGETTMTTATTWTSSMAVSFPHPSAAVYVPTHKRPRHQSMVSSSEGPGGSMLPGIAVGPAAGAPFAAGASASAGFITADFAGELGELMVGLYKLDPFDPELESAWFQPLSLKFDIMVSSLCFQIQLVLLHHDAGPDRRGCLRRTWCWCRDVCGDVRRRSRDADECPVQQRRRVGPGARPQHHPRRRRRGGAVQVELS
jgi:hypothetical protein